MMGVDGLRTFLRKADTAGRVRDIRISVPVFFDPALGQVLKEAGIRDIWVECPPHVLQGDPADLSPEIERTVGKPPYAFQSPVIRFSWRHSSGIFRVSDASS